MDARPKDEIAFGLARINMNNDALGDRSEEIDAEIYYGIHATHWLTIRPNLQYVHHLGGYQDAENVWVGGIKFNTSF